MLKRSEWLGAARKLDWDFSYVEAEDVFPAAAAGQPFLPAAKWENWDEPYRTSFTEYVDGQAKKNAVVAAVRDAIGKVDDFKKLHPVWLNAIKLHAATLPLAEFAAVTGCLRGGRFGRASAWRTAAAFGALDEFRHTEIPLTLFQEFVKIDAQFDWVHKFYHSNNWVAIAARHLMDEMLLGSNAIEFAIATNFVFETGFTNLQFVALSAVAHNVDDKLFERMLASIQSDEARHAQIGPAVLSVIAAEDKEYAQQLLDKWFWRSWQIFAIVTGFAMDYFTPLEKRKLSFREFVNEWVIGQYLKQLDQYGLSKPWYWDFFLKELEYYHHMVYASAYTYRSSVWFDFVVPSPQERAWLSRKYPQSWPDLKPVWERIDARWSVSDPNNDFAVHGTPIVGFCNLCQLVLCAGTPEKNAAVTLSYNGQKYIFCSEPCRWIFEREPERYAEHKDVVKRVLAGEAPANLLALLRQYFGLTYDMWGKDVYGGRYPWIEKARRGSAE